MVIKYVIVVAFLFVGCAQLLRAKPIVDQFKEFGLPSWAVFTVGLLQVAGAIGLLFEATSFPAALGLVLLMIGALANHIKARHPASKCAPAFLLLALTSYHAYSLWLV